MDNYVFENIMLVDGKIINNRWVEWYHWGVPNEISEERENVRKKLAALKHCSVCTSMDACFYAKNSMPEYPQHPKCDCKYYGVSFNKVKRLAKTVFDRGKFTNYIFNKDNPQNQGKYELFTRWGYSVADTDYLLEEMSKQSLEQYLSGNYEIRGNVGYGSTIRIRVNVKGKKFFAGWIILPNGVIRNVTPYCDN